MAFWVATNCTALALIFSSLALPRFRGLTVCLLSIVLRSCLKTLCATTVFLVLMKLLCDVLTAGAGSTCGEGQNLCFLQLSRVSHETHPHRARELPDTGEFTQETVFLFVPKEKLKSKHVCYWSDDRMLREAFMYLHIKRYLFISLILRLNAIGISRLDHC